MSDIIIMPDNHMTKVEDGVSQREILNWIVDNVNEICVDDTLTIHRSSHGYEVEVTR